MNKILIVPDIHGRKFWNKAKELINDVDKVVFLGDYLDPYPHEGVSREEAIENFKDILKFKEKYGDKVVLLLGNHDCAYCYDLGDASRYDYINESAIKELFNKNSDKFQLWYKKGKYLFTHAGIDAEWLYDCFNCNIDQFLEQSDEKVIPYLWVIGAIRGGYSYAGSIVWHDVREGNLEHTYYQIFGHTQLSKPLIADNFACLDVRKCFLLEDEILKPI